MQGWLIQLVPCYTGRLGPSGWKWQNEFEMSSYIFQQYDFLWVFLFKFNFLAPPPRAERARELLISDSFTPCSERKFSKPRRESSLIDTSRLSCCSCFFFCMWAWGSEGFAKTFWKSWQSIAQSNKCAINELSINVSGGLSGWVSRGPHGFLFGMSPIFKCFRLWGPT